VHDGWRSAVRLSEPAVTDRQGIGFGWLQNAWLLHACLKIHRGGIDAPSVASTENPRAGSLSSRVMAAWMALMTHTAVVSLRESDKILHSH
jgi:hypothetical protein